MPPGDARPHMRPPLAALLVVVLVAAGCQSPLGAPEEPSDGRALDALNRSEAAAAEIESYRFTLDGSVDATADGESVTLDVDGSGLVDVSGRRLNASVGVRGGSGSVSPVGGPQAVYLTDYTAYRECARIGWERENLTQSARWLDYTPLGEQLALLDRTNVYWRGTETVDGTEAAVVTASPTKDEFLSVRDALGTADTGLEDASLENATVTLWISEETGLPVQARREIEISQGGGTAAAAVTFRFTGYDESVEVSRPSFDEESLLELGCTA